METWNCIFCQLILCAKFQNPRQPLLWEKYVALQQGDAVTTIVGIISLLSFRGCYFSTLKTAARVLKFCMASYLTKFRGPPLPLQLTLFWADKREKNKINTYQVFRPRTPRREACKFITTGEEVLSSFWPRYLRAWTIIFPHKLAFSWGAYTMVLLVVNCMEISFWTEAKLVREML